MCTIVATMGKNIKHAAATAQYDQRFLDCLYTLKSTALFKSSLEAKSTTPSEAHLGVAHQLTYTAGMTAHMLCPDSVQKQHQL
jgi:hypothetical protein